MRTPLPEGAPRDRAGRLCVLRRELFATGRPRVLRDFCGRKLRIIGTGVRSRIFCGNILRSAQLFDKRRRFCYNNRKLIAPPAFLERRSARRSQYE